MSIVDRMQRQGIDFAFISVPVGLGGAYIKSFRNYRGAARASPLTLLAEGRICCRNSRSLWPRHKTERPTMKLSRWAPLAFVCSSLILGALAFVAWIGLAASTVSAAPLPQGLAISCSSDDMQRHWCAVDTRGGAELIKQ